MIIPNIWENKQCSKPPTSIALGRLKITSPSVLRHSPRTWRPPGFDPRKKCPCRGRGRRYLAIGQTMSLGTTWINGSKIWVDFRGKSSNFHVGPTLASGGLNCLVSFGVKWTFIARLGEYHMQSMSYSISKMEKLGCRCLKFSMEPPVPRLFCAFAMVKCFEKTQCSGK